MSSPRIENKGFYGGGDLQSHLYEVENLKIREQANSVACLILRSLLDQRPDDSYHLRLGSNRKLSVVLPSRHKKECNEEIPLAEDEPFRDEYSVGEGTAFLFAPQYVLTAAHCLCQKNSDHFDEVRISRLRVLFDFKRVSKQEVKCIYSQEEVYSIKEVTLTQSPNSKRQDWAVLKLDREVTGRLPLKLDHLREVTLGKEVYMLGHPLGMPMMLTRSGEVKGSDGSQFQVDLDAFSGNSGSPIFSYKEEAVVGMLIQGHKDFAKQGERLRTVHITQEMIRQAGYERAQKLTTISIFEIFRTMSGLPHLYPHPREGVDYEPLLKVQRTQGYLNRFIDKKRVSIKGYTTLFVAKKTEYEDVRRKNLLYELFGESDDLDLLSHLKPVKLSELFEGNFHVYIEGNAGVGKTTFCRYLVYNWAILTQDKRFEFFGSWADNYEAVIWLPLREIRYHPEKVTLVDLIAKFYPGLRFDKIDPNKILYVLDGFDEIASLEQVCRDHPHDKRWDIVTTLIEQPHWLMTSRPGLFSERFWDSRRLRNLGFSRDDIINYVANFCDDFYIDMPSRLNLQKVFEREDLRAFARIPLYVELLCSLWKEQRDILDSITNIGALYDGLTTEFFRRYLFRYHNMACKGLWGQKVLNHALVLPYLKRLGEIAFLSINAGRNKISPDIYQPLFENENILEKELEKFGECLFNELGFLEPVGDPKELFRQEYSFLHRTFEEYFAAKFIVSSMGSSSGLEARMFVINWLKAYSTHSDVFQVVFFVALLAKSEEEIAGLAEGMDNKKRDDEDASPWQYPLYTAIGLDLFDLSKALIEKKIGIRCEKYDYNYPLNIAVSKKQEQLVKLLIDNGAKIDATVYGGMQAIHIAIKDGNEKMVKLFLDNGVGVETSSADGKRLLHFAVKSGHESMVQLFVNYKADVNAPGRNGNQPLHLAVKGRNKKLVKFFLGKGAKIDGTNRDGCQPIHFAAKNGDKEMVELLIGHFADINAIDCNKSQLIHFAAQGRNQKLVEFLISKGSAVDATNQEGNQPLHFLIKSTRKRNDDSFWDFFSESTITGTALRELEIIIELLLKKGADINAVNYNGDRPLNLAVQYHNWGVVQLLHKMGGKIDTVEENMLVDSSVRECDLQEELKQYRKKVDHVYAALEDMSCL